MILAKSSTTEREFLELVENHLNEPAKSLFQRAFDAHTTAVMYDVQKYVLTGLREHAQKHVHQNNGTRLTLSSPVLEAWEHEVHHIDHALSELEHIHNPVTTPVTPYGDFLDTLRSVFGPNVRIMTTEELMKSLDADVMETKAAPDAGEKGWAGFGTPMNTEGPVVQHNKFADKFMPTHLHVKSGGYYQKLYDASVEETLDHVVVYRNQVGQTFTRPAAEFYDYTRFEELN